jgi:hypothetical protein
MRSFRAEQLNGFVSGVLNGDAGEARAAHKDIAKLYPIRITRDLPTAREWLREKARGSERFGLVASSGAARLRPEGLHVKSEISAEANLTEYYSDFLKFFRNFWAGFGERRTDFCFLKICGRSNEFFNRIGRQQSYPLGEMQAFAAGAKITAEFC